MDCREKIVSEDYADFILSINTDYSTVREEFTKDCVLLTSVNDAVIYRPLSNEWREQSAAELSVENGRRLIEYPYSDVPKLYALMDTAAVEETGAIRLQNYPGLELKGSGIIIGFIGDGLDLYHEAFRYSNGDTRVVGAWNQADQTLEPPFDLEYGSYLSGEQINEELALGTSDLLSRFSYDSSHGTFLAGIAAGNSRADLDFSSVAPFADIAVVKLKPAKQYLRRYYYADRDAQLYQENDIITGVIFLTRLAEELGKPLIICMAHGTSFGAHNGFSVLGDLLNILSVRAGIGICIAGGNEGNSRHHYSGRIRTEGAYEDVEIRVAEELVGLSVELWGESPDIFSVEILSPTGERIPKISTGIAGSSDFEFLFQQTKLAVRYEIVEKRTGAQVVVMKFDQPTAGIWTIRVFGDIILNGIFHVWLPITEIIGRENYFLKPDPFTTLTIPSDTFLPVSVGAYNDETGGIFIESGRGYTTNLSIKPTIVAPGVDILSSDVNDSYTQRSGTSISAAIVAGVMAQFMEWGRRRGNNMDMSTVEIKNYLIRGAKRRPVITYPDREWGYGVLDAYNSLDILRK